MPAEAANEWINCILGGLPENNLLNELIFECLPKEDNDAILGLPAYTYRLPWDKLRDVQHLTLRTYDYYPAEIKHGDTIPTLQTLRLEGIPGLNNEWLVQLADNLQVHDEKWRALRKVWVAQCPGVDLGLLLDLYEGKEVYHDGILLGTEELPVELDVAAEVTEPLEADEAPQPALAEATQAAVEAAETTDPLEPVDIVNHLAAA
ncbi:hypothetical protein DFH11DRAFT_1569672 [Phellopilus nigrolimitatus]|nr:hypothetical protein DFH11DRAFT_1569672 [Phellopilus nigrolimitatus]